MTTLDGVEFDGRSLAGKAAVLWFWAPWCGECRRDAAIVAETAKAYDGKVAFLGVTGWGKLDAMKKFADYKLSGFPHVADVDDKLFTTARIKGTPTLMFYRPDGTSTEHIGSISAEQLADKLNALSQS
ncbi:TlpA family protein disulfide reductase [Kibdelosporangium phytohabitans]|nr:thioredoxin domain-containing protein [Kibdelosporangium phytohabitans]MBE1468222.1 thiol-disulfide isomerase/thioredoxin [Kibdelosporangium phytohabitans]